MLSGFANAHIKDAAALCCFFSWLEKEVAAKHDVTELSASDKLATCRAEQEDFVGLSFDTISSSGPNGAIIHYKPTAESDRPINDREIYLCDSGGQYKDGTTDVTRTMHFGTPTLFQRQCFTRVLKGHISLATCLFPAKIKVRNSYYAINISSSFDLLLLYCVIDPFLKKTNKTKKRTKKTNKKTKNKTKSYWLSLKILNFV